jgi:hypothetical protein
VAVNRDRGIVQQGRMQARAVPIPGLGEARLAPVRLPVGCPKGWFGGGQIILERAKRRQSGLAS